MDRLDDHRPGVAGAYFTHPSLLEDRPDGFVSLRLIPSSLHIPNMTNYMHTDDLLPDSFGNNNCRADLLPKWMRGLATIIVMLSLLFLIIGLSMLFRFGAFGLGEGVMLICSILGVCCGISAAGLLMESEWAVRLSLLTSAGVLLVFIAFLGYDLFFYRMKIWTLVGIEVFVLVITLLYLRGLWKLRRDWETAPQSEVPGK